MASDIEFVKNLTNRFPVLQPLMSEHMQDYGEILPYVFLSDVTRYIVARFIKLKQGGSSDNDLKDLAKKLQHLEEAYSKGDDEVKNLIGASFLEALPRPEEPGGGLRNILGPALTQQLRIIG